jgi:uncharacterized protein (TIGR03435 family)
MNRIWLLIAVAAANGQGQPPAPAFEIISIKPTPKERLYTLKRDCLPDRFEAAGMPLSFLVEWSFGFGSTRLLGLPEWTNDFDLAYDIDAKAAAPMNLQQCKLMVQSLLTERFKMAAHRETREMRAYALVVGKSGSKLRPEGAGVRINGARFQTLSDPEPPKGISMSRLAGILSDYSEVGLPVVDRSGLSGNYSFELVFSMKEGDDRVSVFTAVQQQLGLKLEPVKAPLEVLVVDRIEKASAN